MAAKHTLFLDTDVVLDHLSDRQPFAEYAHRLLALAETGEVEPFVSSLTFSHLHFLLRKGRTHVETIALLVKLKQLVRVLGVGESEVASALASGFTDFGDALQYFAARTHPGIGAVITRNKADYASSALPVLSPEEYLAQRAGKSS